MTTKQRAALRSMCNTMEPRSADRQGRHHRQSRQAVLGRAGGAGADQGQRAEERALHRPRGLRGALRPRARRAGADHRQSLLDLSPGAGKLKDSPRRALSITAKPAFRFGRWLCCGKRKWTAVRRRNMEHFLIPPAALGAKARPAADRRRPARGTADFRRRDTAPEGTARSPRCAAMTGAR